MSAIVEPALPTVALEHRPWWRKKAVLVVGVIVLMWIAYKAWGGEYPWPATLRWDGLSAHLDSFQTWLIDQRTSEDPGLVFSIFDSIRTKLDDVVAWIFQFFRWLTWPGITVIGTLVVAWFGGLRAAMLTLGAFATYALTGLWAESMETFALMIVAVALSLTIGIPLGIAAGRSARVNRFLAPLLDAAQIVPAFAYLMPTGVAGFLRILRVKLARRD